VTTEPPLSMRSVVRRRPGILFRSTADGFLLHTGGAIVEVRGLDAELWSHLVGEVPVGLLVDQRIGGKTEAGPVDEATDVLAALAHLQRRQAVEVVRG
jgi:hypothetical protein